MKTAIALLRGINVSGQKIIKMADLREVCTAAGLHQVRTYVQSGNILFETDVADPRALEQTVHQLILDRFGFDVPVLVKFTDDLQLVVSENPYTEEKGFDLKRLYVTFLGQIPADDRLAKLTEVDYSPEEFIRSEKTIYFFSPNGYGRAKMNNNFFEQKLKVTATTRNWKTVNKLIEMALEKG